VSDGDLNVGLVGFGIAGRVFHAPLIEATPGLRLAGVVTSRRDEVASRYPGAAVNASTDELWDGSDLVVVASPNRTHVELGREAVRRGVPAVIDKPLATTAAAARELVDEAGRVGAKLTVFHNRRWDDDFLTVKRVLREGVLGRVIRMESRFERFRPAVNAGVWRESGDAAAGGGVVLDLGPHLVDQAIALFGSPERVYAEIDTRRSGAAVDDDAFIALEHAGGERSHLSMSAIAPLHGPRIGVSGLEGGYAVDGLDVQEAQLREGMTPDDPAFGRSDRRSRLVTEDGEQPVALERGSYTAFYEGVVGWLRDGAPPPVDPADAVVGLEVLDAARASSAEHRVVEPARG
jgi:predicted dehydrogenase